MSHYLHTPAWNTRLGNLTAKSLLAMLCEEVNDDGFGFPGVARMTARTEINRRTVCRLLDVFVAMKLIRRYEAEVEIRGERVWRDAVQVDTAMLGKDLTVEFAQCYAAAQGKTAVLAASGRWRLSGEKSVSETELPGLRDLFPVSETDDLVSETSKSVSETKPPHPLIGVPLNVPLCVPSRSQSARAEDGLTAEQQEHLDRLTATGAKAFDVESFRLYYLEENRKALAMTAAAEAHAAKELELRLEYPDLERGLGKMRKRCGFAWVEGDLLGPILRQVVEDQAEMGKPFWRTLAQMAAMWELQRKQGPRLRARYGPAKFFSDGHWLDSAGWHWDHEQLKRDEAAGMGSAR